MVDLQDVTSRWVAGWAAARTLPEPEDLGDGIIVHCRQPGREFEIFCGRADVDPGTVDRLAARVLARPEPTWLTVATTRADGVLKRLREAGLDVLKTAEQLMTIDLREHPRFAVPEPYRLVTEASGALVSVELRDPDGEIAARGAAGLTGADAVMDRILTWPEHRRRGLGNAVMSALATAAVARGAAHGLLIASEEGQHLYARLGWAAVADVLISAAPGNEYPG